MRPLYLCLWLTFLLSLACAKNDDSPFVGEWQGSCDMPEGQALFDLRVVDNGGFCETCEGDYPQLNGFAEYLAPNGNLMNLDGIFAHCEDEQGCVDHEQTDLSENYFQYIGRPAIAPNGLTVWFIGAFDPDSPDTFTADGVHAPAQDIAQQGPCVFTRTGKGE